MAKRLPKPFERPGIALQLSGPKKAWQQTVADFVHVGDIVQGHNRGLVEDVEHFDARVRLTFKNGSQETFYLDDKVTAFTEDSSGDSK